MCAVDKDDIDGWQAWMRQVRRLSAATVSSYSYTARDLRGFLAGNGGCVRCLDVATLRGFMARERPSGQPASAETLKRDVAALRSLCGWLCTEYGVPDCTAAVAAESPRVQRNPPRPPDLGVWRVLWGSRLSTGDRVGFGLALFLGLRRSSVVGVQSSQVRTDPTRLVGVRQKGGRTLDLAVGSTMGVWAERLPEWVGRHGGTFMDGLVSLAQERAGRSLLPWERRTADRYEAVRGYGTPDGWISPDTFNRRLRAALRAAGQDSAAITPHQLRHGFGTAMCGAGIPIQVVSRLMGHASLDMTTRYVEVASDPLAGYVNVPPRWAV